jgi:predicted RND superfamily exporter protein
MCHHIQAVNSNVKNVLDNTTSSRNEQAIQNYLSAIRIEVEISNLEDYHQLMVTADAEFSKEFRESMDFTFRNLRSLLNDLR